MATRRSIPTQKTNIYTYGNTVKQLRPEIVRPQEEPEKRLSRATRKNRERAMRMNPGYVLFLTAAAAAMLFLCVHYLQLQADNAAHSKNIARMEKQLTNLKAENDASYSSIIDSVDLAKVKKIATKELGMVYAGRDQIVLYDSQENDYVRQYADVPEDGEVKTKTGE